jgi:hypothetical protein
MTAMPSADFWSFMSIGKGLSRVSWAISAFMTITSSKIDPFLAFPGGN